VRVARFVRRTVAFLALTGWFASGASAQEGTYTFSIPQGTADVVVSAIAEQSDRQILFPFDDIRLIQANGLDGEHTVRNALEIALDGTGLSVAITKRGVITVSFASDRVDRGEDVDVNSSANRRSTLLAGVAAFLFAGGAAEARDNTASAQASERIVVTGSRIVRSGMITPVPVTAVQANELASMSPGTLYESLIQLPLFYANSAPGAGSQGSGGANLNLRGAGINRTLVLLDSRRVVPSNRFGAVDIGVIPEEVLRTVETVTGGASASYGTDAVAGVVNFILDTEFTGLKAHAQLGETRYGDGRTYELGATFGADIGARGHLIASIERSKTEAIDTLESVRDRGFYLQRARVTNPDFTPDFANGPRELIRPFVSPTNWNETGIINQPGSSLDKLVFNPDGTLGTLTFSGVGAIDAGCNCMAEPTQTYAGLGRYHGVEPGYERTNAFIYYEHELGENLNVFGQLMLGDNEHLDPFSDSLTLNLAFAPRVFADNAYLPDSVRQTMLQPGQASIVAGSDGVPSVGFALYAGQPLPNGDTIRITKNEFASATVGFNLDIETQGFFDGWQASAYYQRGENDLSFDVENGIRADRIPLALDAVRHPVTDEIVCYVSIVDPVNFGDCVPMNIFGGAQNLTPEALEYIVDDYKHTIQNTSQDFVEFVMTGDVWRGFGAGAVSGAFGASYRSEELDQSTPDPTDEYPATPGGVLLSDLGLLPEGIRGLIPQNSPGGIPGVRNVPRSYTGDSNSSVVAFSGLRSITGSYDVTEVFGELNVPIVADQSWAQQLDANAAVRWADYSGSGEVWAGKLGLNWQVNDVIRLRATQSRDVRAASLRERFDQTRNAVSVQDPANANPITGAIPTVTTQRLSGGNPNVNPELADTTTVGVVFQPAQIEGFSVSLDWYAIDISDAIAQLAPQTVVTNCFNGDATLCQYVLRDPGTNVILEVQDLFVNFASQKVEGIDLEMSYRAGPISWRLFATQLMENSLQNPGGPVDDRVGDIGTAGLPEFKVTTNVTYTTGPLSIFLQERFIDGGEIDRSREVGVDVDVNSVPSTYYTDLGVRYTLGDAEQWELFGNVNNLFDQAPRATPSALARNGIVEFDPTIYDVLGRRFVVGVRRSF
jgi:outer membrane receptor protein involved in Fe transport